MPSANRPNRILMNKALRIFLDEMVPYVIQEVETTAGQPIEVAAIEVFGENVGTQFIQDLGINNSGGLRRSFALTRISLTVDFFWPIFKKRLRNRKVTSGALKQIEYASVSSADGDQDLEPLYIEQRLDDISNVLGRIGANDARREIEDMKKSINYV